MLNSILANVIAGLGLFFTGLRLIDTSLRQATGRRLRMAVGRVTRSAWLSGIVGVLTGAVLQSTSGIVFILVSLVRRFPGDAEDDLSKPQFLYDEALDEPATALDLVEQEQLRLARGQPVDPRDRAVLLQVTSVFERIIWMTHRLARLIDRQARHPLETDEGPADATGVDLASTTW